jgi:hypothetical protein
MDEILQNLPPAVMVVLALMLLVWLVLLLLVPFMIESIRGWTRKSYIELQEMNERLDKLHGLLADHAAASRADALRSFEPTLEPIRGEIRPEPRQPPPAPRDPRPPRVRKEPTISG